MRLRPGLPVLHGLQEVGDGGGEEGLEDVDDGGHPDGPSDVPDVGGLETVPGGGAELGQEGREGLGRVVHSKSYHRLFSLHGNAIKNQQKAILGGFELVLHGIKELA